MMTATTNTIVGLSKALVDPQSGAPIEFYTISQYTIRANGSSQVVLQGYVSKATRDQGKSALAHSAIEITAVPPDGANHYQWFYQQIPGLENCQMTGAIPVRGEL